MRKNTKRLTRGTQVRLIEVLEAMKADTTEHMTGQAVLLYSFNKISELDDLTKKLTYGRNLVSKIRHGRVPKYTYLVNDADFVECLRLAQKIKYLKDVNLSSLNIKFTDYRAPEVIDPTLIAYRQAEAFVYHRLPTGQRVCDISGNPLTLPDNLRAIFLEAEFQEYEALLRYTGKENIVELAADIIPLVASYGEKWVSHYVKR